MNYMCLLPLLDQVRKLVCFLYGEQGTTVRVEFGDSTTCADPSSEHVISRAFPHTFGQPLAHFLRATAKVPDAQIITEHPPMRFVNMSSSAVCLVCNIFLINICRYKFEPYSEIYIEKLSYNINANIGWKIHTTFPVNFLRSENH